MWLRTIIQYSVLTRRYKYSHARNNLLMTSNVGLTSSFLFYGRYPVYIHLPNNLELRNWWQLWFYPLIFDLIWSIRYILNSKIIHIAERRALTIRPPILGKVTYNGKFAIKCVNVRLLWWEQHYNDAPLLN